MTAPQGTEALPISTTFDLPGYRVTQSLGLCWGVIVRSMGIGRSVTGGFKSLKRGEVPQYTATVDEARHHAVERLVEHAQKLGATAILGVRFDSSDVAEGVSEIIAYGTACTVEPAS